MKGFFIGMFVVVTALVMTMWVLVLFFPQVFVKMQRRIMEKSKQDLKEMADIGAEVNQDAVTKTTKAVKRGLSEKKAFCKECGAEIDADSKFCKKCGQKQ